MRRLIRNIQGEQWPLIMHPRLYWLRALDRRLRYHTCRMLGLQFRVPRYMTRQRTPAQRARTLLAIEAYVGRRSPDPRLVRYYEERRRLLQLTAPRVSDDAKRLLVAEGPRCSPEDEAHVLDLYEKNGRWSGDPEAQAALARIKQEAELTIARFAGSGF